MIEFNLQSPQHLSLLFFGGMLPIEEIQDEGFYKNGKPKTKKIKILKNIKGLGLKPLVEWKTKKEGIYSVDEDTLQLLSTQLVTQGFNSKQVSAQNIAKLMLEIRGLNKLLSTYYKSIEELIFPDNCVHPQFQHVSTSTGRLSCKSPNVQNQPKNTKIVHAHFISRFFEGKLISADYSSIEVRIEAQLSRDEQYIKDINNNVDFHIKNLALKEGMDYESVAELVSNEPDEWGKKRSVIKGFTFAQQYGAGNQTISQNTGLSVEEIQTIRENRKIEYPRLHLYYDWLKEEVNKTGQYRDPWGRIYKFKKYPPKFKWQKSDSYSPTEIQNYKTQGFATSSIVLSMLGIFFREKVLDNRDKYLLINTIHDSVMVDCKKEYVDILTKDMLILEEVNRVSEEYFKYKFIIPIKIDISTGSNWSEL